jgi:hypothetical protein
MKLVFRILLLEYVNKDVSILLYTAHAVVKNYSIPLLKDVQHRLHQCTVKTFRFIYIKNSGLQSLFLTSNAEVALSMVWVANFYKYYFF